MGAPRTAECFEDLGRGPPRPENRNVQNRRMLQGFVVFGAFREARKAINRRMLRGSLKLGGAIGGRIGDSYEDPGGPAGPPGAVPGGRKPKIDECFDDPGPRPSGSVRAPTNLPLHPGESPPD